MSCTADWLYGGLAVQRTGCTTDWLYAETRVTYVISTISKSVLSDVHKVHLALKKLNKVRCLNTG